MTRHKAVAAIRRALPGLAAVALAATLLAGVDAARAADREAVAARLAEAFNAEVLRIENGKVSGQAVWLVTLMREGGNDNAAFKVDTIAVDPETGEPLRGALPDGRGLSTARTGLTEKRPAVLRDRPWR